MLIGRDAFANYSAQTFIPAISSNKQGVITMKHIRAPFGAASINDLCREKSFADSNEIPPE